MSKSKGGGGTGLVICIAAGLILAGAHDHNRGRGHGNASVLSVSAASLDTGSNVSTGRRLAAARGWRGAQFTCLDKLWDQESGWRTDADETTSIDGQPPTYAYGIPQALPASKMASAGADWRTDPATQIRWGLSYIAGRYGSPCGAWEHEEANSWY